jgi:hypothetical protein
MTSRLAGAVCAVTGGLLLSCGVHAAQVGVFAKVSAGQVYAIEAEINDFTNASAIDLVHPTAGTFPLIFDRGEENWDVVSEDLTLSELNAFFDETFDFEITHGGGLSIYTAARFGPPGADRFPEPASSLTVGPSTNPFRPTASWTGGDETADFMIINYGKGDDEFTDGIEAPEADGARTLGQDLEPGTYEVTLGFYALFDPFSLSLIEGDDVLGISEVDPAMVGETFSSTTVVPLPASIWFLISGLGTLALTQLRKTKQ